MEIEKEEKPGSSKAQASIEDHIFIQIKNGLLKINGINLDGLRSGNPDAKGTKFQVDFFIPNRLLGEIYTCKSKLLPGQRKKIYSDILKMLTIEKIWGNPSVPKVIVLVLSQNEFTKQNIPNEKFISKDHEEFNILNNLGKNTWIQKTIELFGIQIHYYLLNSERSQMLEIQQANQKR
jgi:hypothetical protein